MRTRTIALISAGVIATFTTGASAQTPASPCPAPASWFPHSQTPPPNPATFPGSNATNCDFHQWAWQMFLWLTQDVDGQLRFVTFPTDADLFSVADPTKKPASLEELKASTRKHPLQLRVRGLKPFKAGTTINDPNRVIQASGGILVDQNQRAVYYSVHFDPVFYGFIQANGYYDYNTYIKANPATDFPPGATELKAAWRIVPKGGDAGGAYTTQAEIPMLQQDPSTGAITVDPTKPPQVATVALVGLHVVGVVANHPEFIWATFEPVSNAPVLPANMKPSDNTPVSSSNFTFYKAGTFASACNLQNSSPKLNAATQTFAQVTQVFLQYPQGGGSAENIANINAINASVQSQLLPNEVWKNYNLIGGVWLLPGALQPGMSPSGADLHGSPNLNNTTMETFVQAYLNCFSCHNTESTQTSGGLSIPAMNMNLSHVLTDGLVSRETALRTLKAKAAK